MKSKSKKIAAITASSAGVLVMLLLGAKAVFTDDGNDGIFTFGREGTIDVSVSELEIDDKTNINPGDCDPYNAIKAASSRPGTEHLVPFSVTNSGTKSIRTRQVITITANDKNGNQINPSVFMLSTLEKDSYKEILADGSDVQHKYYLLSDGTRLEVTGTQAFYVDETGKQTTMIGRIGAEPSAENITALNLKAHIVGVQYVIISDVLDGTSKQEGVAEIENEVQKCTQSYDYYLGMYHDTLTNGYSDTTALSPDGKYYLSKGLVYENSTHSVKQGTEVKRIIDGKFKEASIFAPDGKIYLKDAYTTDSGVVGTEVTYVNMKYYQGVTKCPLDDNYYLAEDTYVDNITKEITGTLVKRTESRGVVTYTNTVTGKTVEEDELARWDTTGHVLSNEDKSYFVFAEDGTYEQVQENDLAKWATVDGKVTKVVTGINADKYVLASDENVEVEPNKLAHFDSEYNLITDSNFAGYEGCTVEVLVEIQAMQYRNTTNIDWQEWTTYDSTKFQYGISDHYSADVTVIE